VLVENDLPLPRRERPIEVGQASKLVHRHGFRVWA
jgi:hypothetical protein